MRSNAVCSLFAPLASVALFAFALLPVAGCVADAGGDPDDTDKMRTSSDIGVGSSEGAMLAAIPAARCRTTRGFRNCVVGEELPGRTVTTFALDRQRITAISIGLIID